MKSSKTKQTTICGRWDMSRIDIALGAFDKTCLSSLSWLWAGFYKHYKGYKKHISLCQDKPVGKINQDKVTSEVGVKYQTQLTSFLGDHVNGLRHPPLSGAIIGDEERKSWDKRAPMISCNFSILEHIAPSWYHISALINARVVISRVDVVTLRDQMVRVADFSQQCQGIRQGREIRVLCPELMEKVAFSGSKFSLISRCEWITSTRAKF